MSQQIIFFGSSPFSVLVLQQLLDANIKIASVVTFPDKPVGRHLKLTPNSVKVLAQKYHIPVFEKQIDFIKNYELKIKNYIALVAAYGKIIKPEVLSIFNVQIFNIHPSLLPKYRGPSPLQQQILDGVTETGVTIIQLDNEMDHGPILFQQSASLLPNDTTQSLGNRLFSLGTKEFIKLINDNSLKIENCKLKIQDDSLASYTHKLTKQDGFLKYEEFISYLKIKNLKFKIERLYRAFMPWPGVWSILPNGKRLKLVSIDPPLVQQESSPHPIPISQLT